MLVRGSVSLMVLDLNMPDMHGLDVLKFVRAHDHYKSTPIIVLTTKYDDDSRKAALAAGASDYLTKPFQPAVLLDHAARLLNSR